MMQSNQPAYSKTWASVNRLDQIHRNKTAFTAENCSFLFRMLPRNCVTCDITPIPFAVLLTTNLAASPFSPDCHVFVSITLLQQKHGIRQKLPIYGMGLAYRTQTKRNGVLHSAGRERGFPQFV